MPENMYGYAGKILIINLTDRTSETIDSAPYVSEWIGGHGLASKLFWDYCTDKTVGPYDPENVNIIAANPFSGTTTPSSSARVEFTGIGAFSWPKKWYTRSSMGGRIAGMMKAAGYDATVITGVADAPVWINVVNDEITFNDASDLWGTTDTWEAQEIIWDRVTGNTPDGEWFNLTNRRDGGRSAERPAVLAIGAAGENQVTWSTVVHDAGHVTGLSGFGAVWGSKNLKAMSFIGSKSFEIADPADLLDARIDLQERFGYHVDNPTNETPDVTACPYGDIVRAPGLGMMGGMLGGVGREAMTSRPQGCLGCYRNCRVITDTSVGNEAMCAASVVHGYYGLPNALELNNKTNTLINRLGINGLELRIMPYLRNLYKMGIMGVGKEIETDLDFENYNSYEFSEDFFTRVAYRKEIGADLAEGCAAAIDKWGRWEEDTATGLCDRPNWGAQLHYDPRIEVNWGYATILSDRDINVHATNFTLYHTPNRWRAFGIEPWWTAEEYATMHANQLGLSDPRCFDFSAEGIYSDYMIEGVQWFRYHSIFWTNTMGMCDFAWPYIVNQANYVPGEDNSGATPEFELRFFKAVTGYEMTYEESLDYGRKIELLDRAIWVAQGRERTDEVFTEYIYNVPRKNYACLLIEDGEWKYSMNEGGRTLDREKFETVKDRIYEWDGNDNSGYPKRSTLESYNMSEVADYLDSVGKIGQE